MSGEQGKGSGRSIPKFDLHGALGQSREHLLRYGGHRAAAGVTIARDKVRDFAARFNEVARSVLTPADLVPEIRVDLEVSIDGLDGRIESLFRHFEPFGIGNPTPVLLARSVTIARPPRPVGEHGLKLALDTGTGSLEALGWGLADRAELDSVGAAVRRLPLEARFAAYPTYNHPLLLQGRKVALGYPGHLWSQGFAYTTTYNLLTKLMQGSENWREIARALHIRYIFWGREETINYPASKQPWKTTATLIASGPWGAIYDLGLTTNQDE